MPSFVPSAGSAQAIKACMEKALCEQAALDLPSLQQGMQVGLDKATSFQVSLGGQNDCLIDAMTAAFTEAGESMPGLPSPPSIPDLTDSQTAVDDIASSLSAIADPLSVFGGVITITFDGNGLPTQIDF
jgi:hypothetical protein